MNRYYVAAIKMSSRCEDGYLATLPLVHYLNRVKTLSFRQNVTFLVGENGSGKSTLVEAIAVCAGYNAEGGSRNYNFSTRQTVSDLHAYMRVAREAHAEDGFFVRAESFYNVASQVDELVKAAPGGRAWLAQYGGKSLHAQSHGESFLSLVQNRFRGNALYILDEPESALSPLRQMTLLAEIDRLVRCNSQFIIATHSPILMAYPGATIYQITPDGIETVAYERCEHYQLTKRFLADPAHFMRELFRSSETA